MGGIYPSFSGVKTIKTAGGTSRSCRCRKFAGGRDIAPRRVLYLPSRLISPEPSRWLREAGMQEAEDDEGERRRCAPNSPGFLLHWYMVISLEMALEAGNPEEVIGETPAEAFLGWLLEDILLKRRRKEKRA